MNKTKFSYSKPFLTALLSVAVVASVQPPALAEDQDLKTLVAEGLTRIYGISNTPFAAKNTKPGDASSGVEVARTKDTLSIDATPCLNNQPKRIVTFVKPYLESKISDAKCNDKRYPQIQVIQQ
jgi:hypothetical protein